MKLSSRVKKLEDKKSNNRPRCICHAGKINEEAVWAKHLAAHPEDQGQQPYFWDVGDGVLKDGESLVMSDMTHEETLDYLD
jgi:hypothetical protein